MSGPDTPVDDRPLDPRTPRTWKLGFGLGGGLGVVLAALLGIAGADGRAGFAGLLVGLSFGCAVGGVYGVGSAALDSLRGRPVGRSRVIAGAVLALLAFVFSIMLAGIGG